MSFLRPATFALLLVFAGACGGDSALEDELIGAWYGEGPDGDQCFVFCGGGRVFTGDRPCDDSDASDFSSSLPASFGDDTVILTLEDRDPVTLTDVTVSGDTFTYNFFGGPFTVSRTTSPDYCSTRP